MSRSARRALAAGLARALLLPLPLPLFLVLCLPGSLVHAAAPSAELHCPATLAETPVAGGVPPGWAVHVAPGELRLQRAAFYDGDPAGLGARVPDATHRDGQTETSTWRFGDDESAHVWIGCLYRDASAVVTRPLPAGLSQCTTTTRLTTLGDPAGLLSVQCR